MKIEGASQELLDDGLAEWQPVASAPYGVDLEVAVIHGADAHAVVFPCRRVVYGWINARSATSVELHPSHWRQWE